MRAMVGLVLVLMLAGAVVGDAQAGVIHRDYDYIWRVNIGENNYLWINVYGNFTTSHGCTERWYARSKYELSDERTKAMLQMAMASFLSQSQVHVWTDGCTTEGYPIMIQLQLQQP